MPIDQPKLVNFSKSGVSFSLPNLLMLPKENWERFWQETLGQLFDEVFPVRDYTGKELELDVAGFDLGEPEYSSDLEAKQDNESYEAPFRARFRLTNLKTKEVKEQEVFLGYFPLMTERGTFIINGVERVVISQLIRSPGVFFTCEFRGGKKFFGAKIIPNRGAWLEFQTEKNGAISVKIDRKRKVACTALIRALGFGANEEIKKLFSEQDQGEVKFIEQTLKDDPTKNQDEALIAIYQRLRPGDLVTPETAKELVDNTFLNFERYDLSEVGRWKMGQRLPGLKFQIPNSKPQILRQAQDPERSRGAKSKIQTSKKNKAEITKEDRVLKPEDVVEVLKEIIRLNNDPEAEPDQIDHLGNRRVRGMHELLKNRLRLGLTRMVRVIKDRMSTLDIHTVTPLEAVNPRPLSSVIKEFFTSSQLAQFMDNENPLAELEHKRRLSATGPGGLARERAGFEVRDVQPSHYGRICPIQTPEGPNVGLVGHLASFARINSYGFIETPYFKVKQARMTGGIDYLTAYEEEKFIIAHAGVSLKKGRIVPEKVEARVKGRAGLALKNQIDYIDVSPEQCVSIATSLIPFLQNTDANRALMGSNMQRQAVPLLIPERPLVCTGNEIRVAKDSGLQAITEEDGEVLEVDAGRITVKPRAKNLKPKTYELNTFSRTNQYTCLHQKPLVERGQKVRKGQALSSGGGIDGDCLALGKNVLVAFLPWRGANFEDAIVISERLAKEDVFTSVHIESFVCDVRETKLGPEITTDDIPNVSEEKLKDLDAEGIIRVGAWAEPGGILVGKISPKGEQDLTPEERLLRAIFGEKAREVKDTSLRMEHGKKGRVIEVKVFDREEGYNLDPGVIKRVEVEVASARKIQAGDKLAGRHGNKGVVSRVLPLEEMPFLKDGTPVDVVLNPLGVVSRMNLGQILELHLAWAAKKLGYIAVTPALSGATEEDIRLELKKAGLPLDGKAELFDGRTGEMFQEKVSVGYLYMVKLIHMVEDKIHMRSIGPYSLITKQPLGGKAQFGGQRFGEMEVWALEGYGASHILQEMLTVKSDDVQGRTSAYQSILKGQDIKNPNLPASFNLLVQELKALGINVILKEKDNKAK